MLYHHTQFGRVIIISLIVSAGLAAPLLALSGQGYLIPVVVVVGAIAGSLFSTLTIEIKDGELLFWFGIGLIRKRMSLSAVASCKSTTTSILSGWGIHLTLRGWLYNVSGFNAVEITLKSGKRFLLGSDEPNTLCAAINNELGRSQAGK